MKYLIDSYAWIEYLDGTIKGKKVRELLMQDYEIYTITLTIAEVISRIKRKNGNVDIAYEAINANTKVIWETAEVAKEAGVFHAQIREKIKDFGLVDALIYVNARKLGAKIVTGDEHFRTFKDVVFLKD